MVPGPSADPPASPTAATPTAPVRDVPAGSRRLAHVPALDGLRGVAWAAVFVTHAGILTWLAGGQTAMFVFFGLSGFLITAVVVNEHSARGRVSLRRFFARRIRRLAPALLVFLAVWLAVVTVFGDQPWIRSIPGGTPGAAEPFTVALEGVGAAAGYVTNWFGILHLFTGYVPLGHLWSLAVEEQIYLVWAPLLLVLLLWRRRAAVVAALVLAAVSLGEVFAMEFDHHGYGGDRMYMGTDTRAAAFLLGGALAVAWAHGGLSRWHRRLPGALLTATALALLTTAVLWMQDGAGPWRYSLTWTAATIGGPLLVLALLSGDGGPLAALLSGPVVTYLGRRSYALYLWHYVWLTWLRSLGWAGIGLALVLTLACAEASWRLVEARFLTRRPPAADPTAGPAVDVRASPETDAVPALAGTD
jgi:peptidoglycan/LPS O-acetylase OafA/YrhL